MVKELSVGFPADSFLWKNKGMGKADRNLAIQQYSYYNGIVNKYDISSGQGEIPDRR